LSSSPIGPFIFFFLPRHTGEGREGESHKDDLRNVEITI
jgi:hypothetical protein